MTGDLTAAQYRVGHDACSAAACVKALAHGHRSHHWITERFSGKPNSGSKLQVFKPTKPVVPQTMQRRTISIEFATSGQPLTGLPSALSKMAGNPFPCLKLVDISTM